MIDWIEWRSGFKKLKLKGVDRACKVQNILIKKFPLKYWI